MNYYDAHADRYFRKTVSIDMSALYKPFLALLPQNAHILDAGCGSGRDTKHFLELGYKVTAIDSSPKIIEISSKFTGQQTILMPFQNIDFDNCFDGIWASASLLHVPQNELDLVFQNLIKATKPNGVWYISFKVGNSERIDSNGRFFNDQDEQSFCNFLKAYKALRIYFINSAVADSANELNQQWLNVVLKVDK